MSLLLLAIALQAAPAARAATEADLRCLAVIGAIDSSKLSPPQRAGLQASTLYFVGRIDARSPGADLKTGIERALGQGAKVLQPEIQRCSAMVEQRVRQIAAAGAAVEADRRAAAAAAVAKPK